MISANFVIPYPPGFPIMVPGQVVTTETIDFMRKLDVKEIHGYERAKGLKPSAPITQGTASRASATFQPHPGLGPRPKERHSDDRLAVRRSAPTRSWRSS